MPKRSSTLPVQSSEPIYSEFQLTPLLEALQAVKGGDFSVRLPESKNGVLSQIYKAFNEVVNLNQHEAEEIVRVGRLVGREGRMTERAHLKNAAGSWAQSIDSINVLIEDLARPTTEVARVITAVAEGDLAQKMALEIEGTPVKGEFLRIGTTVNKMVDQLGSFAAEVTRVAREVGTEGKLGGQAKVPGVSGTWKDLTDNVNLLAGNLTDQVRNIAKVTTAVANGDLSQKITVDAKGEVLELKDTINTMVDQLNSFSDEVNRVAREVGTEGKLGGQAKVHGVSGTWKDLTDNVNFMATNLTTQVRGIAKVVTAVANGDLTQSLVLEAKGEVAELADTINSMTGTLSTFAEQVTTVAREVGTEGKLGGQAVVPNVAGTWKNLTDNVNFMASNLTTQVRGIARVVTAVANGDLQQTLDLEAKGEVAALVETINSMTNTLSTFAKQVTTVAREVGTEGKLGGQAEVPGVAGTWKDLTDNVNLLAGNLTDQVRNIAKVTTAVANGDLSQKITVDVRGEVLELKNTINIMVDQLNSFADEVTRVAREVGTEGILGGQAAVPGVSGTWKDLTDNVNFMASNLTSQVREIALVTTAVANGDLSQKITVDVRGEVLELKNTINVMVDQLNSFAAEVTRVAREVGTEGKLGVQAEVPGVSGTWKDLTDNVNSMATNLTDQVRNIALVTTAVANGDLSQKITVDAKGEVSELKNTINIMVDQLRSFADEVTRVAREVGTEGILGGQANVRGVSGTWKDLTDNVNFMAANLTTQVRGIVKVVTAVANGDLNQKLQVQAKGEVAALAETINSMTDTLSTFAEQVTAVAREVGTEGILGGQAKVPGVAGTWKDLTDSVNVMASNLTTQVRGIAKVVTAVANGDLKQKLVLEAKGEVAALAETINSMTETLSTFAEQVTTVAREVGTEGKLGGQAKVPNVAGTWKDLTDNVNYMADSLTVQVRAIQDVATAVAQGDLTRTITVAAQGEVQALKDNINQMIANLKATTDQNSSQDWLKTNLARFSGMMQGQKSLDSVAKLIMSELTPLVDAHHGVFYMAESPGFGDPVLRLLSSYAYKERKNVSSRFAIGEGLVGQCALERKSIVLTSVPDDYIRISSGLGDSPPHNIIVLPVLFEGEIMAVIELASFNRFSEIHRTFLDQLMESIGVVLNMISANMRTEELLKQSQSLTQELQSQSQELQSQQEQLRATNTELEDQAKELEEKAALLEERNRAVEQKNKEVELARAALEEQAKELAISSKYKSEFLANMSHELRTPLNSMLILAKLMSDNPERNLSEKQVEFAHTIYGSGNDLLNLINEILDLTKIEAGKMEIEMGNVSLPELRDYVERSFRHVAEQKNLDFVVRVDPDAPHVVRTDSLRLQQILRNLLSNAFKFTSSGSVLLDIVPADREVVLDNGKVLEAKDMVAFKVKDTGVGIARDKQNIIFEAFQQADGTTSRKYGGTGLGLSISREITKLLGGRIRLESTPGVGSEFVLYLPIQSLATRPVETTPSKPSSEIAPFRELPMHPQELVSALRTETVRDDRNSINSGDRVLLIIEDDPTFAGVILDIARGQGFKGLVALDGESGLAMAHEYLPEAITLDLRLPTLDGWKLLDELKRDTRTRHIPVQVVSVVDPSRGAIMNAISYLEKPVTREALEGAMTHINEFIDKSVKEMLVVEDDAVQRTSIREMLGADDLNITEAATGKDALEALKSQRFDCMVLDLSLPDMAGFDVLKRSKRHPLNKNLPVIIYTSKDLSKQEESQLKKYAATIITKSAGSSEHLLDETAMFLHRVIEKMPDSKRDIVKKRERPRDEAIPKTNGNGKRPARPVVTMSVSSGNEQLIDGDLVGKKVLIVDDDVRNIFALTSALESQGMVVLFEESGPAAIETLKGTSGIELVLMDVMMPDMDGYETIRRIRDIAGFSALPIIALTAKAMAGDREKCIQAGATDYIAKPVDMAHLFNMIRKEVGTMAGYAV
jgi:HAMP domain-containing protein/signal transduction histidine kinase/DNA-binding response OmpR family regulator